MEKKFDEKPFISVIIPAINPINWETVIKNLYSDKIKFEIIFLGPFKPINKLPNYCRYIKTFVKPPQCLEIGYKQSNGNLIMQFADDCKFSVEDPLCKIFDLWKKTGSNLNRLISCKYRTENWEPAEADYRFMPWDKISPLIPMTPLIPKILFKKFKSYDRRFTAVLADVDLYMRLIRAGVKFDFSEIYYVENKKINVGNLLLNDYWMKDKIFLDKLWIDNSNKPLEERKFAPQRNLEVEEFDEDNLIDITQEPKGKWKHNNIFYNKIIHNPIFYFFKNLLNSVQANPERKFFYTYLVSLIKLNKYGKLIINFIKKYK